MCGQLFSNALDGEMARQTKRSEARLLALMKATSDVIYRMSPDWKTMTELYGRGFLADTEKPDVHWLDKYIHPDDQEHVTGVIESCIRDKRMFELEHRVLRADGSIGWTYSRAVPILHEDGGIREWFGVASDITGRRRAAEALRESEAKYRNLFDSIDEGYCIVEVLFDGENRPFDYRFLEVNESFEKQTGLVNAAGRRMRDMVPDHEQRWFDIYGQIALTGEPVRFQNPAEALGRFYDVYAYRVGAPEQRRVAILFNDITDRRKAEEALRGKTRQLEEANRQKEDILESISDCFYALDRELRFTYVNKAAEKIWGIQRADLLGRGIMDVFPDLIGISLSKFRQALEQQTPQHYEVFSKVIGRWGDMDVYPMREGVSVYFRDTTERKQAEEALQESERVALELVRELQTVKDELTLEVESLLKLHRISQLILSQDDRQSIFDSILETAIDLSHADKGNIQVFDEDANTRKFIAQRAFNKPFLDYFESTTTETGSCGVSFQERKPVVVKDVQKSPIFMGKPDMRHMVEEEVYACQSTPMISSAGNIIGILSTHYKALHVFSEREIRMLEILSRWAADIIEINLAQRTLQESERRALALVKELEEADRNKDQFINTLSHELRNPLAVLVTGIEILEISEDKKRLEATKGILNRQVRQLCALVDDLLDLTRISKNRIRLKKEPVELGRLAAQAAEDQREVFAENGITLHTITGRDPIRLHADPVRIRQIIGNLLSNAQKYTRPGGEVLLSVSAEGDEAVIRVKDDGIGLSPEIMSRLFQPFTQADLSLDRKNGGLGLGLSITKGITELHGGTVSASSEGLGKGSEFVIRLPLAAAGPE